MCLLFRLSTVHVCVVCVCVCVCVFFLSLVVCIERCCWDEVYLEEVRFRLAMNGRLDSPPNKLLVYWGLERGVCVCVCVLVTLCVHV